MRRKTVSGMMLALLLVGMLTLTFNIQLAKSEPTTIVVPDDYEKIQWAIGNASVGDTILASAGTYCEDVIVDKSLNIKSVSGASVTKIIAGSASCGVRITADYVNFNGFTVEGGPPAPPYPTWKTGMVLDHVSYCNISNNVAINNTYGIFLYGTVNNIITRNVALNNTDGLWLDIPQQTGYTILSNNIMNSNSHSGFYLYSSLLSHNLILVNNTANYNHQRGIYFSACQGATVIGNELKWNNDSGTYLSISNFITMRNNEISDNGIGIKLDASADKNIIYHNNMINNENQVYMSKSINNTWDDGYPSGGNYWSDYGGVDLYSGQYQNENGSDGIGDTPHVIDGNNTDRYPLMQPYMYVCTLVSLNPIEYTAQVGDSFTIDVNITDVIGLCGYEFKLLWNTTILDCVDSTINRIWYPNDWILQDKINATQGSYSVAYCALPSSGFNGSATLVSLTFEAIEEGNCTLQLYNVLLGDCSANPIEHTSLDGFVTVGVFPKVYLVPSEIKLNTNEVSVGYRFNVAAWVSNVTDLGGWQVALYYNASVINTTSHSSGYFDSWGYVLLANLISPPFTGTTKLTVFEFEIIASPPEDQNLTSPLIISPENVPPGGVFETKLRNSTGGVIPFLATDGHFEYSWSPACIHPPVRNINTGLCYVTIQEAIDAPETLDGHTIFVEAGTYYENVTIDKSISLIGEDKDTTVVDGNGSLRVVAIYSDGVSISGFTVMHSYGELGQGGGGLVVGGVGNVEISDIIACNNDADWGVHLNPNSHDVNITRTVIVTNSRGGLMLHRTWKVEVSNNIITNNAYWAGVRLHCSSNNTFSGNTITNNKYDGIHLLNASSNTICGNDITNNYDGIRLFEISNYNAIYGNNITANNDCGVLLSESFNNSIFGNNIANNDYDGIHLLNSSSNTICGNNITANTWNGILLDGSSNNTIYGNNIEKNLYGIHLLDASNNSICGDNITNNVEGIRLLRSSNNTFRNNNVSNNRNNFVIYGLEPSYFIHDIDDSNIVDGKPVYYWVNRQDMVVPLDAGYVALINCTRITIKNLDLTNNGQGVLLVFTTNSTITKNNVTDNYCGIWLCWSSNNTVSGNNITDNWDGIRLDWSSNNCISGNNITANDWFGIRLGFYESSNYNTISRNQITNNEYGIGLDHSSNNTISENTVTNNQHGIYLADASNYNSICGNSITNNEYGIYLAYAFFNTVYHNNFIGNAKQVYDCFWEEFPPFSSINTWDDGYPSGGNYWSDHDCNYNPSDGSQPYIMDENNIDHYPFQDPNGWLLTLFGDLNKDRKVDMRDISLAASAFGSYPNHPRWNPIADINEDNKVDMRDLATVARNFGETI